MASEAPPELCCAVENAAGPVEALVPAGRTFTTQPSAVLDSKSHCEQFGFPPTAGQDRVYAGIRQVLAHAPALQTAVAFGWTQLVQDAPQWAASVSLKQVPPHIWKPALQ